MKYASLALVVTIGLTSFINAWCQEPVKRPVLPTAGDAVGVDAVATDLAQSSPPAARLSRDEARRQAALLHATIHSTLQIVHHRYYREDEGLPLPAATLIEVFAELEASQHVKLRWLAVEGQAMNTDHKPRDEYELLAVQALKSGKKQYEQIKGGIYRHTGAITLHNHCLKCHVPDRKSTQDRTAGLIIALPVQQK